MYSSLLLVVVLVLVLLLVVVIIVVMIIVIIVMIVIVILLIMIAHGSDRPRLRLSEASHVLSTWVFDYNFTNYNLSF